MQCRMCTDVWTWTNWLNFGPDPNTYRPPIAAATSGFQMVLLTASHRNTFVGGTCTLLTALLVIIIIITDRQTYMTGGGSRDTQLTDK